jgi:YVTN family beta-propeller protein
MLYNSQRDKLYCANDGGHALAVIDCGTGRAHGTVEVGREPNALACSPDGEKLYCTNKADGTVSVIDCECDRVVSSIKVGGEPTSLCISPPNHRLLCATGSSEYGEKSTISVIDCRNDSVISKLVFGKYPTVSYDSVNDRVFCVSRVDPQPNEPTNQINAVGAKSLACAFSAELKGYLVGMSYDRSHDRLYVACDRPNEISAIDCRTGVSKSVMRTEGQPQELVYNPHQHKLYVASFVQAAGGDSSGNNNSEFPQSKTSYGTIEVLNTDGDRPAARISIPSFPNGLLYVPEVNRVYCACDDPDIVVVIDCAADTIVDRKAVQTFPATLVYSPKHRVVYVANSGASSITPISISNDASGAPVERTPRFH